MDAEGVHRDGFLLGIADILAAEVFAQSLVRVTRIDHHHIRTLFVQLAHDRVHMKTLARARGSEAEKIRIIREFPLSLFSRDVDSYGYTLPVCVVNFQRRILAVLHPLLVHQAHRRVR